MNELNDQQLMQRARDGEINAAVELFRRHERAAWHLAYQMTGDTHAADDLVAEATVAVLGAFRNGNGPRTHFRAYLNTTVRRLIYYYSGRDLVDHIGSYAEMDEVALPTPDHAEQLAHDAVVAAAFLALPTNWREVLWDVEVEGRTLNDVAARRGKTPAGATSELHRARQGLRNSYHAQNPHECIGDACHAAKKRQCIHSVA